MTLRCTHNFYIGRYDPLGFIIIYADHGQLRDQLNRKMMQFMP